MLIHILDSVRTNAVRCADPFTVYVPEGFDRPVVTGCMDRRGLAYTLVDLPVALSWYRSSTSHLNSPCTWHVCFADSWLDTVPGLYHADFSAGYSGAWPSSGWPRPGVLPTGGAAVLSDAVSMSGQLWGYLAQGVPVEPVRCSMRRQFRQWGFGLHIAGDPPESVEDRCVWLLESSVDPGVTAHNQTVARSIIAGEILHWFAEIPPVWARDTMHHRRRVLDHAVAWGLAVA